MKRYLVLVSVMLLVSVRGRAHAIQGANFDADGFDDLAIGVHWEGVPWSSGEVQWAGAVNVLYGQTGVGLAAAGDQLWHQGYSSILGIPEYPDQFGDALATGDFNGDGYDDMAVGVPGESRGDPPAGYAGAVNVIYGSGSGLTHVGDQLLDRYILGEFIEPQDRFGGALASGDFNFDGYDDLVVGAPRASWGSLVSCGAVYIVPGSSTGLDPARTLAAHGSESHSYFGTALAVGLFDTYVDDLAVGAPKQTADGVDNAGVVHIFYFNFYLWYGEPILTIDYDNVYQGKDGGEQAPEEGDWFGYRLASGHLDGGCDALVIAAPYEDLDFKRSINNGLVHVLYSNGCLGFDYADPGNETWWQGKGSILETPQENDLFGYSLTTGDFDNDGYEDLVVGAHHEYDIVDSAIDNMAGVVHVIHGSMSGLTETGNQLWHQGTDIGDTPELNDAFGQAVDAGDYNGDGYADLAIGVPTESFHDTIDGRLHVLYGSGDGLTSAGSQLWSQDTPGVNGVAEWQDGFGYALRGTGYC